MARTLKSVTTANGDTRYTAEIFPSLRLDGARWVGTDYDHLGSTTTIVDKATGEVMQASAYQTYGAPDSDYRPARWGALREPYRFTGKEDDIEVGLTYFGARYYHAALGRWMSADPLTVHALGADPNPYAYVSGSPLAQRDPIGLCRAALVHGGASRRLVRRPRPPRRHSLMIADR